jgi:aquaporin NIP
MLAEAIGTFFLVLMVAATVLEFLLSFSLMFVIMAVATDERVPGGFSAIAIGLTVGFCALMAGPLTGASMNPARSLGPAIASGNWHALWIYWIARQLVCWRGHAFTTY